MAQPYVGEIRMFAGSYPPAGWLFCDGQPLAVAEYEPLFQVIGAAYGGDGVETFNLPNLRGRIPVHAGTGADGIEYPLGRMAGSERATLTVGELPPHAHPLMGSALPAGEESPAGGVTGGTTANLYGQLGPLRTMNPGVVAPAGGAQSHENCQPFVCVSYIISLFGAVPNPAPGA